MATEKLSNEEIVQAAASRTRHDVKLLDGGAVFVIDSEDAAPRLELTADQVKTASPEIKTTEKERLIELWDKLLTNNSEAPEWSEKFNFTPEAEHLRVPLMQLFELIIADPNAIAAVRLKDQGSGIGYENFVLLGADKVRSVLNWSTMNPNDQDFARQVVAAFEITLESIKRQLGEPSGWAVQHGKVFKQDMCFNRQEPSKVFSLMDLHFKIGIASEGGRMADFCFTMLNSRADGWAEYQRVMFEILRDPFLNELEYTKDDIYRFVFTTMAEALGARAGLSKKIKHFFPFVYDRISSAPKKN